jgi:hypothetical protein
MTTLLARGLACTVTFCAAIKFGDDDRFDRIHALAQRALICRNCAKHRLASIPQYPIQVIDNAYRSQIGVEIELE